MSAEQLDVQMDLFIHGHPQNETLSHAQDEYTTVQTIGLLGSWLRLDIFEGHICLKPFGEVFQGGWKARQ